MSSTSFCLSSAAILRCVPLTHFQSIVILIPTVPEVLFTTFLILILWRSGHRRHLLLTAESWMYFILSVLELLTHVLDAAQTNVQAFAALDITIGVGSFLPLFFYCFFLYIYVDSELLPNAVSLPKKLGKVGSLLLIILIPGIVGANELASFVGIDRRANPNNPAQILVGFTSQKSLILNVFFSSLSLALITLFQAIVFLISGFRLAVAILNQRRYENLGQDATHMVKGMGWISAGMKIGAIESVIGFAGGSFGVVITRRIFRFLGRACLCIGIVKGVDEVEDFRAVRRELSYARKSRFNPKDVKNLISNPRFSSFQQLSPSANGFYTLPQAHLLANPTFDYNKNEKFSSTAPATPEGQLRSLYDLGGIATFETLGRERKERVTIHYPSSGGAPTLELRLSMAGFPSPKFPPESRKPRQTSDWTIPRRQSQFRDSGYAISQDKYVWDEKQEYPSYVPGISDVEGQSRDSAAQSVTESSVEIVIAPQRTLSQSSARARLYQPSSASKSTKSESIIYPALPISGNGRPATPPMPGSPPKAGLQQFNSSLPAQLESPQPDQESDATASSNKYRVASGYSFQSLPDSLRAVRELASEFPGPPLTYNGRPVLAGLQVKDWSDVKAKNSRASIVPTAFVPPTDSGARDRKVRPKVEDEEKALGSNTKYASRPVIMPSTKSDRRRRRGSKPPRIFISPAIPPDAQRAGKAILPRDDHGPSLKPKLSNISSVTTISNRSIDPFDDDQSPRTSVQRIIDRPTLLRPRPRLDSAPAFPSHDVSVPSTPEANTPLSWLNLTPPATMAPIFQAGVVRKGEDRWKYDSSVLPSPPDRAFTPGEGLPRTPLRDSYMADPSNSRFSFPLSSGASSFGDRTPGRRSPSHVVWVPQEVVEKEEEEEQQQQERQEPKRRRSAEEEHRRQQSIDAAAHTLSNSIPWLTNPEMEEEQDRRLQNAMSATGKPKVSRIKTVGHVDSMKPTPRHTVGPMRKSLHAVPIMIPPPSESYADVIVVAT